MQIFHTGREEYDRPSGWNFDAAEFVRQYGQDMVALEKYKQQLYMKREQEFLALMDVKTDNLIFEQYQMKAAEDIDNFVKGATNKFKNKDGILSTQDKMELQKTRQQMQMKIDGMRAKAEQFLKERDVYASRPENFDVEETNAKFKVFIDDPVNKPVPQAVPKYYDPIYLLRKELDTTYKWQTPSEGSVVKKGDGTWSKTVKQTRTGIETEEQAREVAYSIFKNNYQVERGVRKAYQGDFEKFFNAAKPHLMPREYEDTGSSSSVNYGGYTTKNIKFYTTSAGVFGAAGAPLDVTISVDEKSVKADFVGMNADYITYAPKRVIDEPDYETTEQILKLAGKDNSTEQGLKEAANFIEEKKASDPQDKMVLNIYKRIFDLNALIKGEDGKWYFKKRAQEIKIPTTENSLNDLSKGLSGYQGFNTEFNAWKGQYFKSTQPTSEPNAKSKWEKNKR